MASGEISSGAIRWVVPSGQDGSILPARVANHSTGFDSSCPLAELAIDVLLSSIAVYFYKLLYSDSGKQLVKIYINTTHQNV